jgi:hypothetical protein
MLVSNMLLALAVLRSGNTQKNLGEGRQFTVSVVSFAGCCRRKAQSRQASKTEAR